MISFIAVAQHWPEELDLGPQGLQPQGAARREQERVLPLVARARAEILRVAGLGLQEDPGECHLKNEKQIE